MNQLYGMCVFSQSFDWLSAKNLYFLLLIFPFRQRMVTSRQVLGILLCWFVLGCQANWDSDDDPGKWWQLLTWNIISCSPWMSKCGITLYRVAHEKPARRLVDQRGRRSRTLYRKLNANWKYLLVREVLKMISLYVSALLCTLQHIVIHAMQLSGVSSPNWKHWVASRVWQYAAACTEVHWSTRRSFSVPSLTSKYFAFDFV